MKQIRILTGIALLMFIVACFLPVFTNTQVYGRFPGWLAFIMSLSMIGESSMFTDFTSTVGPFSALTNIWFLLSAVMVLFRPRRYPRAFFIGLVLCTIINILWIPTGDLAIGYYLWFGSFIILTIASYLAFRLPAASPETT